MATQIYCIAGFEKVKSAHEFVSIANHNNRIKLSEKDKDRVDQKRSHLNKVVCNPLGIDPKDAADINQKIQDFYNDNKIKVRKDNVLAIDLMLTTSPEFWGEWQKNGVLSDPQKIDDWVQTQLDYLEKTFGKDAVKYAVVHLDEKTPHMHVLITPEETKTKKYKNQKGEFFKTETALNADRWNPAFWKNKFLSGYAKANAKYGLTRGEMDSQAENVPVDEFYQKMKTAMSVDYKKAVAKILGEVINELSIVNTKSGVEKILNEKLLPKLTPMFKSQKVLKEYLKLDRTGEYKKIQDLKKKLEADMAEVNEQKEHYGKGLRRIMSLEDELVDIKAENEKLKNKNSELEEKIRNRYLPKADANNKLKV